MGYGWGSAYKYICVQYWVQNKYKLNFKKQLETSRLLDYEETNTAQILYSFVLVAIVREQCTQSKLYPMQCQI
jgi:hypothetical protein